MVMSTTNVALVSSILSLQESSSYIAGVLAMQLYQMQIVSTSSYLPISLLLIACGEL
jgi:hypothetical protein